MARYSSRPVDRVLGRRSAKRTKDTEQDLSAAEAIEAKKAGTFKKRYGKDGKGPRYTSEHALYGKDGPEHRLGVVFQRRGKTIEYERPDVMIRRKKRFFNINKADKFISEIPGKTDSEGRTETYVSRVVKARGTEKLEYDADGNIKNKRAHRKLIDSEYDADLNLIRKTKLRSRGRREERWERDTEGRLIRTHFSTSRKRDHVLFSPITETMSALKDGKRILTQKKGRKFNTRVNTFERDEVTGKLTPVGRKGLFGEKGVSFKPDGSLDTTFSKRGIISDENTKYLGENLKRVTTKRLFRSPKTKTVELTDKERSQRQLLREAKQQAVRENLARLPPDGGVESEKPAVVTAQPPVAAVQPPVVTAQTTPAVAAQTQDPWSAFLPKPEGTQRSAGADTSTVQPPVAAVQPAVVTAQTTPTVAAQTQDPWSAFLPKPEGTQRSTGADTSTAKPSIPRLGSHQRSLTETRTTPPPTAPTPEEWKPFSRRPGTDEDRLALMASLQPKPSAAIISRSANSHNSKPPSGSNKDGNVQAAPLQSAAPDGPSRFALPSGGITQVFSAGTSTPRTFDHRDDRGRG